MADRHKGPPKAVRMPGSLQAWYERHAAESGQSVNAAIVAALQDYRQRHEPAPVSIGGVEIGITADPRQPPGIVSVVSRGEEVTEVRSFTLAPEPRECAHESLRMTKGVCPDCSTYVTRKP